jgi:hypothetical protein
MRAKRIGLLALASRWDRDLVVMMAAILVGSTGWVTSGSVCENYHEVLRVS